MADEKLVDGSYLELLLELKRAIMVQLRVASLAIVRQVDTTNKTLKCDLFPVLDDEQTKTIVCRYFNIEPDKDDIILVLFLDKSFETNLKRMERGDSTILKLTDNIFHSEDYGIAIQIIIKKESEE